MTRGEIWKDFFKKTVLTVLIAGVLFYWATLVFTKDGATNYFYVWLCCGIPFGIRRMFVWLIPRGFDLSGTVGVVALNFIVGGLIGGVILIWRLADMAGLIKNVTTYQKTKPVYDAYRRAKDKAAYRAAHESSLILFEAAAKAVKPALVGGKLPNVAALQAEYAKLQEQKETLCADYGRLKKQVKEYDVIKRNIDSILRRESEPERGKENVRG